MVDDISSLLVFAIIHLHNFVVITFYAHSFFFFFFYLVFINEMEWSIVSACPGLIGIFSKSSKD